MSQEVKLRRGTAAQMSGFTGAEGELTYDVTNKRPVIHDGATLGGIPIVTGDVNAVISATITTIVRLQQFEYDALESPDDSTLYLILPNQVRLDKGQIWFAGRDLQF